MPEGHSTDLGHCTRWKSEYSETMQVAIVGGGLCGLALAIALKKRSIPFTIYEARSSFTELGAGINLGPNTLEAFRLIDPALSEEVLKLCTKNPPPKEHLWMTVRLGGPTNTFEDAKVVAELNAPPTGNATVRRNDLLQLLADAAGLEHAQFNKKLVDLIETEGQVNLTFSDNSTAAASIVVACDGIHSAVRRKLLGASHPAANPEYSQVGAYRAVVSTSDLEAAIGSTIARSSTLFLGPARTGYIIMYPVELGDKVNIGLWVRKPGTWDEREWVLPDQRREMEADFGAWGKTVHKIMDLVGDPPFWPTFCHLSQPDSLHSDGICLIGDSAHSMPPHQGAGAGQAMEDAFVLAEVLGASNGADVKAALKAYEAVRTPRSQKVLQTSVEAMGFWSDIHHAELSEEDVRRFAQEAQERFRWIWQDDIAGQARRARESMEHMNVKQ